MRLILLVLTLMQSANCFAQQVGALSIVVDDMGYSRNNFQALSLPTEISFSILPFTPYGKQLAEEAHRQGRELLLHIPMEAKSHNCKLGKGALMLNMQEKEFKATLTRSLSFIPYAKGINNHMGSALTEQIIPMRWTMEVLKKQGFYFLDSRTSKKTIAEVTAKTLDVPALRRDIFLDNIKTVEAMEKEFQRAILLTKTHETVIIIAHPYPSTLHFLKNKFSNSNPNIKLTALNQLISKAQRLAMTQKRIFFQQANNQNISKTLLQTQ